MSAILVQKCRFEYYHQTHYVPSVWHDYNALENIYYGWIRWRSLKHTHTQFYELTPMIHNKIPGRCILIKTFLPVYIWFWTNKCRMTQQTRNFIFPNFSVEHHFCCSEPYLFRSSSLLHWNWTIKKADKFVFSQQKLKIKRKRD